VRVDDAVARNQGLDTYYTMIGNTAVVTNMHSFHQEVLASDYSFSSRMRRPAYQYPFAENIVVAYLEK
jgi:hypothetical protein